MQAATLADYWTAIEALPTWQGFTLVVGGSLLLAAAINVGGNVLVPRLTRSIPGDVDDVILGGLHPAMYVTVVLAGAGLGLLLFDLEPATLEGIRNAMLSIVTVVWAITLVRIGRGVSRRVTDSRYIDRQVVPIFQNVWSVVVIGVSIVLLLAFWEIDVTPLLASAGILGIVIGLAARDTIANFFGSLSLYVDGTYRVGDYVVLESGERGRVEDISVRSTVIRTRDDILVTVPNALLNNGTVVNESTPKRKRRIRVPVGVAYGTDIDEVETLLLEAAEGQEQVLERPSPRVRFREFGDSALQFELLCWVPNPAARARVTHHLNTAIYHAFQDAGVEIPFPQRDVRVSVTGTDRVDGDGALSAVDAADRTETADELDGEPATD